ncbi:MAG TPA: hypothetical protein VHZ76_10185, partial [Gammaproteobacteria bacterium]|nr:hypothetical protein [Gammaproteobacteria bacterium]
MQHNETNGEKAPNNFVPANPVPANPAPALDKNEAVLHGMLMRTSGVEALSLSNGAAEALSNGISPAELIVEPTPALTEADIISDIRSRYGSATQRNPIRDPEQRLNKLIDKTQFESDWLWNLKNSIVRYATENLNQVDVSDHYTNDSIDIASTRNVASKKIKTDPNRVAAVNNLLGIINNSSAQTAYQYMLTPKFQMYAGMKQWHFGISKVHLSDVCKEYIKTYQEFIALKNNDVLLDILLSARIREDITNQQLAILFWYYNSNLVAEVICKIYLRETFRWEHDLAHISYDELQLLLAGDQDVLYRVNKIRAEFKAPALLPENACFPGKDPLAEEGLDKFALFQYDDSTILAVEQYLRENYSSLLINNISGLPNNGHRHPEVPYYFYQIPAGDYMLLAASDTKSAFYFRYDNFKKDLSSLLSGYSSRTTFAPDGKPIIFFGIINYNNTHYLSYFIHKNNEGKIKVIVIDSSPRTYPDDVIYDQDKEGKLVKSKRYVDERVNAMLNVTEAFHDIFPISSVQQQCEVVFPEVTLMLRQRDCGPHAAEINDLALQGLTTPTPLFFIDTATDTLSINMDYLPNHPPLGVDPYAKKFVYSPDVTATSSAVRKKWQERLLAINHIKFLIIDNPSGLPNPVRAIFSSYTVDANAGMEYEYNRLVADQQHQDVHESSLSAVQALLLVKEGGGELVASLKAQYKSVWELPSEDRLVRFIQLNTTEAERQSLLTLHTDLTVLCKDVIVMILRDSILESLRSTFKERLTTLPHRTDLNAAEITDDFLREHNAIYFKLTMREQRTLVFDIDMLTKAAINEICISIYKTAVSNAFLARFRDYLKQLATERMLNSREITNEILAKIDDLSQCIRFLSGDSDLITAIRYLAIHDRRNLSHQIESAANQAILKTNRETLQHMQGRLKLANGKLSEILARYSAQSGEFILFNKDTIKPYLLPTSIDRSAMLIQTELNTILAAHALDYINREIKILADRRIKELLYECILNFLQTENVTSTLITDKTLANLTDLTQLDRNLNQVLSRQLGEYAQQIARINFNHRAIQPLVHHNLIMGIRDIAGAELDRQLNEIIMAVIQANADKMTLAQLEQSGFKLHDNQSVCWVNLMIGQFLAANSEENRQLRDDFFRDFILGINDQQRYVYNKLGERLLSIFILVNSLTRLIDRFTQLKRLSDNLANSNKLFTGFIANLSDIDVNKYAKMIAFTRKKTDQFMRMKKTIDNLSLMDDVKVVKAETTKINVVNPGAIKADKPRVSDGLILAEDEIKNEVEDDDARFAAMQAEFELMEVDLTRTEVQSDYPQLLMSTIKDFVTYVFMHPDYRAGNIAAGSISVLFRPTLCGLLGIRTGRIVTREQADKVDDQIAILSKREDIFSGLAVREETDLLYLNKVESLPSTYGKDLTGTMLIQCIAFWYSRSSLNLPVPAIFMSDDPLLIGLL